MPIPPEGQQITARAYWTGSKMLLFYTSGSASEQMTSYDTCSDSWSAPTASQTGVADATQGIVGSTFLAFGPNAHARLDPSSLTWSEMNMQGGPPPEGYVPVFLLPDGLLVAGSTAAYRYELARDSWRQVGPVPAGARVGGTGFVFGTSLVVWGVFPGTTGEVSTGGVVYDLARDTWRAMPAGGVTAGDAFMVASETDLYIWSPYSNVGAIYDVAADAWRPMHGGTFSVGTTATWDSGKIYAFDRGPTVQAYDPASDTWSPVAASGTPAFGTDVGVPHVMADGRILLAGGSNVGAVFDPSSGSWTAFNQAGATSDAMLVTLWTGSRLLEWGSYTEKQLGCPPQPQPCFEGNQEPIYTLTGQAYRP